MARTAVTRVRLTDEELEDLRRRSSALGCESVSDYIRLALSVRGVGGKFSTFPVLDRSTYEGMLREHNRWGVNLNQIAHSLNYIAKALREAGGFHGLDPESREELILNLKAASADAVGARAEVIKMRRELKELVAAKAPLPWAGRFKKGGGA